MATIPFTQVTGLGTHYPEVPPEVRSTISAFGFPTVLKKLHVGLKSAINRIPKNDSAGKPMREHFLKCIAMDLSNQAAVEKFCSKLGFESALRDLLDKRITQMTAMDFIVDPNLATPDAASYKAVVEQVIGEEHKRFSRVPMRENEQHTEWDEMERDDSPGR
jgi:hypothetical protein